VNGRVVTGPVTIFKNTNVREVSFCTLGADENTHAYAFSARESEKTDRRQEDMENELKEKVFRLEEKISGLELSLADSKAENEKVKAELKLFKLKKLKDIMGDAPAEEIEKFSNLDVSQIELMAVRFGLKRNTPPAGELETTTVVSEHELANTMANL
jgi:hypothetical protein